MERQRPTPSPSPVHISRQLAPKPTHWPDEEEEALGYEELDERLAPGGTIFGSINRTAGWGC
jgi:hypothetical protein